MSKVHLAKCPSVVVGSAQIRKEFSAQVAGASLVETDVSDVIWVRGADVIVSVEKTLRRISVRVDHDGRIMNGACQSTD